MRFYLAAMLVTCCAALAAQDLRPKDVREIGKGGVSAIPRLQDLLKNPNRDIRIEAVKQITAIGTQHSLDPLIAATKDNDPDVQMRATDGLVDFYLPGYVQSGLGGSIKRFGAGIKGHFTDTDDQAVPAYVTVRPEVIAALGALAHGGSSTDSRANACRAIGILRGKGAVDDLVAAAHSKNSDVIYEALIALQKIHDESAGPKIEFLFHDFDARVQGTALETAGLLRDMTAVPAIAEVLNRTRDIKVKRSALTALAMLPAESSRPLYQQYLTDKDERLRAAAAEGFARLHNPADLPALQSAWQSETKTAPRLSLAFAQVMLGSRKVDNFSPLGFLINNLDSASYKGEALPFLVELARDQNVRQALYPALAGGTKDEKIGLAQVLARSGDQASLAPLQKLTTDPDSDVSKAALRAVRDLQSRLPG